MSASLPGSLLALLALLALAIFSGSPSALAQKASSADITSLEYRVESGTSHTHAGITFSGDRAVIASFTTGTEAAGNQVVYNPLEYTGSIVTTLRRSSSAPNNSIGFYQQDGSQANVHGSYATQSDLFNDNNLYTGTDNLFTNTGNGDGNNNNIERVDVVFSNGLDVTEALAFLVLERGLPTGHDGFQIAAILGIDEDGSPLAFGNLVTFGSGSYGQTDLFPETSNATTVLREPLPSGEFNVISTTLQRIGGTTIAVYDDGDAATLDLGIALGETIYGYALFATDVNPGGDLSRLLDISDDIVYPKNTAESGTSGNAGGIDLVGYTGVAVYAVPVPEPATWATLGAGAALLAGLQRWRRKQNR